MAKKKKNPTKTQVPGSEVAYVNPFSSGGGGGYFELKVAVYFLVGVLTGAVRRGAKNWLVRSVRLQQRNRGYHVDDIICDLQSGSENATISLQIKHGIRFTENDDDFKDGIRQCWLQFRGAKFNEINDRIGIGFDEGSNIEKIRKHFQEVLNWARTSESSSSFFEKVKGFLAKSQFIDSIRSILNENSDNPPTDDEIWRFLKCFTAIPFDFNSDDSRDEIDLVGSLCQLASDGVPQVATGIADQLYAIAAEHAKNGGELTIDTLCRRLGPAISDRIPTARKTQATALLSHLRKLTIQEIEKQVNSGKFIPKLFTETIDSKDCARSVIDPVFFFRKVLDGVSSLNLTHLNRMRRDYKLPSLEVPSDFPVPNQLVDVERHCDEVLAMLSDFSGKLKKPSGNSSKLDKHTLYVLEKRWHTTSEWYIERCIETIRQQIRSMKCSVLLVTSDAGRGKTNYLCDLAQLLVKFQVPGVFFTGKSLEIASLDDLEKWILRLMIPGATSISEAYSAINQLCQNSNKPCIILIDAINEHSNLQLFAGALERCIEDMTAKAPIRFILTCRSEFFEARFGDFSTACFSKKMVRIDRLNEWMHQHHAHRMVDSYLNAFCLRVTMSSRCRRELERNPLLLRIFCEAYGNPESPQPIQLPHIESIYKDRLFQEYLDLKLSAVAERANRKNNTTIHGKAEYLQALFELINVMFSKNDFSSVALAELNSKDKQTVGELLYEELLLRRDLKQELDTVKQEVLVIPFDELRDFLIAKYLVEVVLKKDDQLFLERTRKLLTAQQTVTEGVARCLFFVARRAGRHSLYDLIRNEEWFKCSFIDSIFAIEDELIKRDDLDEICNRFDSDPPQRVPIFAYLIRRINEEAFPNLNIKLLFRLLRELNENDRRKLMQDLFGQYQSFGSPRPQLTGIGNLAREVIEVHGRLPPGSFRNLVQLMLFLINVSENGYEYPAKNAIVTLFESDFELVNDEIIQFISQSPSVNTPYVIDTVADMIERQRRLSPTFHQFALAKWNGVCDAQTTRSLLQYFEACVKIEGTHIPSEVRQLIENNRKEIEQFLKRF